MAAAVPVPATASEVGEFAALLRNEMFPEVAPAAWGANVSVKEMLWPAAIVTGKLIPLRAKPLPVPLPDDTVTAAEELALSVPVLALLLPTVTWPKLEGDKESESWAATPPPLPAGVVPVPVSASEAGEFDALLTNEMLSDTAPVVCGAKVTVKEML